MGRAEAYVENYLVSECERRGWLCYKFTSPSNAGVPDRCIIGNGRVLFIETKHPGDKPRKLQVMTHKKMRACGADVRVCDTRELVDAALADMEGS